MVHWHLIPFSKFMGLVLLFILPNLLLLLVYFTKSMSCVLLEWELFSFGGLEFSVPLLLDKVSLIFSSTVVLISLGVMLFSVSYMSGDKSLEYFIYMVMLFVLSMNFLIFIPHLVFLLLGWDGLGLTSYLLVIYYQNNKSLAAGMITVMSNRIGDSLIILAICWTFCNSNWVASVGIWQTFFLTGVFLMMGAMTKSAQVPFSAWLPAAMAAPTPVSSLVHSSTLVTAGVYLLVRFYSFLSGYEYYEYCVFYIGVVTCLMASLSAIYENDLKKIIALSTLSQLGMMFMALGLNSPLMAFFHLITHALFKALLFICAGTIIHSLQNNQDIRMMGNLSLSMPVTCVSLNVASLALCGFPFMAGFYSKDLIVESVMYSYLPMSTTFFMMVSVCLTSVYSVRLLLLTMWNPYKGKVLLIVSDESVVVYVPFLMLLLGGVMGGAGLSWLLFPFSNVMSLPLLLKVMVLVLVIVVGACSYVFVGSGMELRVGYFMGSMWFLSWITSHPGVGVAFSVSNVYYSQEISWMELVSGKALLLYFSKVSTVLQKVQNLSFSNYFSMLTILVGCSLMFL